MYQYSFAVAFKHDAWWMILRKNPNPVLVDKWINGLGGHSDTALCDCTWRATDSGNSGHARTFDILTPDIGSTNNAFCYDLCFIHYAC